MRGRGRAPLAQQIVELMDGRPESALETVSRLALPAALPQPELQVTLTTMGGAFLGRVDFYWQELGLIGEAAGRVKYESGDRSGDEKALWKEKQRADRFTDLGGVVVRWGWREVHRRERLSAKIHQGVERARAIRQAGVPLLLVPRNAHNIAA